MVAALPTTGNFDGRVVYLSADGKLYRYVGAQSAWSRAVDGADIVANSVTSGSIAAGAITASQIQAGAVSASKLVIADFTVDALPDDATSYVDTGQQPPALKPRPALPTFDKTAITATGQDAATLSGLPNPCTVTVDATPYTVTDGTFVLTATMPATYQVVATAWPYLNMMVDVVAS